MLNLLNRLSFRFRNEFPCVDNKEGQAAGEDEERELAEGVLQGFGHVLDKNCAKMGNFSSKIGQKLTLIGKNVNPTNKLAAQLTMTAIEFAFPRADESKISETKNHGMAPGPVANEMTKRRTSTMAEYEAH